MAVIEYIPRSKFASPRINFATPEALVIVQVEEKVTAPEAAIEWLLENNPEFKLCVDEKIIIIDYDIPPGQEFKPERAVVATPTVAPLPGTNPEPTEGSSVVITNPVAESPPAFSGGISLEDEDNLFS